MNDPNSSSLDVYNDHYSSQTKIYQEWTELASFTRLNNTLKVIGNHQFNSIVDVGAGDGIVLQRLGESGRFGTLNAVEIAESAVEVIKSRPIAQRGEVKQFDGYNIPFASNSVDLASCYHVIEHVENPRALLREMARVSRYQIFEIPLDYRPDVDKNINFLMSYGHISVYTPSLFKFLLKSEGFEIVADHRSDLPWSMQEFMILHSKKQHYRQLRLLKARLLNVKRGIQRTFSSPLLNAEYSYANYTCFCQFKGKPRIEYKQAELW